MKNLEKTLLDFTQILEKLKIEGKMRSYALIGALAVSARGRPRATGDIDFLVSAEKDFFDKTLPEIIKSMGYDVKVFRGDYDDPLGGLVRVYDDNNMGLVDIIPVFWKWQDDMVRDAEYLTLKDKVTIPVVRAEDLIVLKLKAGGHQDIVDVEELIKITRIEKGLDKNRLLKLAKRAKVDIMLEKMLTD